MLNFEKQYYNEKIKLICGVDEAGRGPLCGPVVASAVILKEDFYCELINDSKKMSEKDREKAREAGSVLFSGLQGISDGICSRHFICPGRGYP